MRVLAIESSAKAASVAVMEDGKLVAQYMQNSGLTHSRTLLSMAGDILKNLGFSMKDVDAVAAAKGPGSFTGIRIGVAAAKGLAWGAEKPVIGVSTLEAMAYHLADRDGVICPVMDARRGQVYNAKFEAIDSGLTRLCSDRAVTVEELVFEAKNDRRAYFFVGDGAEICYNTFLKERLLAFIAPEPIRMQSAWGVAMASLVAEPSSPDDLVPQYLRLSQAERERLAKKDI
ncbi:MAG: tRNA (adenosine(37)-N6)-threonylcarbamoyltransferase complex dimerization subunit type 1 TsaB [Oscillospiraceae bacterium]